LNWPKTGVVIGTLRKLEAMLIAASADEILVISGTGDVLEPDHQVGSHWLWSHVCAIRSAGAKEILHRR